MPMASIWFRRAACLSLFLATLLTNACATSNAVKLGESAERAEDFDRAVVEYTRAIRQNPDDRRARLGLDRVKVRASQNHFFRGRRLAAAERYEEAAGRVPDRLRAEPERRRRRRGASRHEATAADEGVACPAAARPSCRRSSSAPAISPRPVSISRLAPSCRTRWSSARRAAARSSRRWRGSPASTSSSTRRFATRPSASIFATSPCRRRSPR